MDSHATSLEKTLTAGSGGSRLATSLSSEFDPHSGLQYWQRNYRLEGSYEAPTSMPQEAWIEDTLTSFIRGEFGQAPSATRRVGNAPSFDNREYVDRLSLAQSYLESCERELVFSGYASAVASSGTAGDEVDKLHALLVHDVLGNAHNTKNVTTEHFRDLVGPRIAASERLVFAFPSFPFKDQNPFRTESEPDQPDLSEIVMLAHLHTLSVAIFQAYHLGAEWLVLSDGTAYADALRVEPAAARRYEATLRWYRDFLDLGRAVSIVNLRDLCENVVGRETWSACEKELQDRILSVREESDAGSALQSLVRGMKRNTNLSDVRGATSWNDWWEILNGPRDAVPRSRAYLWDQVDQIARVSASKYAAFNLAMRHFGVEAAALPGVIRATIHPKPGQIAVPRLGTEFPWNGVALVRGTDATVGGVSTVPLHSIDGLPGSKSRLVDENGRTFAFRVDES